ncbi:DNA translocase FtsK [Patescibacteria group bacterium]|nr:DNA translocase FtsK [Patescibacteria group bacterium]
MGRKKQSSIKKALKKKKGEKFQGKDFYTVIGIILLILSILSFIGIFIHIILISFIYTLFGEGIVIFAIFAFLLSLRFLGTEIKFNTLSSIIGLVIFMLSTLAIINLFYPHNISMTLSEQGKLGGAIGFIVSNILINYLTKIGAIIILLPVIAISFLMSLSFSFTEAIRSMKWGVNTIVEFLGSLFSREIKPKENKPEDNIKNIEFEVQNPSTIGDEMIGGNISLKKEKPHNNEFIDPSAIHYENWEIPSVDLLANIEKDNNENLDEIKRNSDIIERTLGSFNITSKIVDVSVGAVVTRYALQITIGTKVSKINELSRDLALALAAPSGAVRVEAPIPGTSLVGIELPNMKPQTIGLKNILVSKEYNNPKLKLPLAMGEDVTGKIIVRDLSEMPHILIAGATGSGKSILINSFLIGLLYRHSPDTLKLILVDPKHVELSLYNGIPHLLTPVITNMDTVVNSLKWAVSEMDRRYHVLKESGSRNIDTYNSLANDGEKLSNIVIVIDEMADLMLTKGKDAEHHIVRLAQMARAVGIHLILATQRPSVNVIKGIIKANIPARIALSVTSMMDSMVILDQPGAETLVGKGDMLFKSPDIGKPIRVQGALIGESEINKIIKFISDQGVETEYNEDLLNSGNIISGEEMNMGMYEDELFPEAVRIVVMAGRGSASILQSKLKIGYARAARLILELENNGVVGPQDGSKPRDVLISDADSYLNSLSLKA